MMAAPAAAGVSTGIPSTFPDKLMALLERNAAPEALWWLRDIGDTTGAFAIRRKTFTEQLLDKSFNGNKWPSITRNLSRWGFKQVSYPQLPPDTTAYYHPLFQPNRSDLLKMMVQDKAKAKMAIQQFGQKKSRKETPSMLATTSFKLASSAVSENQSSVNRVGSDVSLGEVLLDAPNLAIAEMRQRVLPEAGRRLQTSVESQVPSLQTSALEGQGTENTLLSSLRRGSFASTSDNDFQLALMQSPATVAANTMQGTFNAGLQAPIPSTLSGAAGEDSSAPSRPLFTQQEMIAVQAQQLQQSNQLQNHFLQLQTNHYQQQDSFNLSQQTSLSQANTIDENYSQHQDVMLLQLEMEEKHRQRQQLQMQTAQQHLGLGQPAHQFRQPQESTSQDISAHQLMQQQEQQLRQLQTDFDQQQLHHWNQQQHAMNHPMAQNQEMKQQSPQQQLLLDPSQLEPNQILGIPALQSPTGIPGALVGAGENVFARNMNTLPSVEEQTILQQIFLRQQQQNDGSQNHPGEGDGNANGNAG